MMMYSCTSAMREPVCMANVLKGLIVVLLLTMIAATSAQAETSNQSPNPPSEVTIGVRAHLGREEAISRWQPTMDYLSTQFPNTEFRLKTYASPSAIEQGAANKEYDFVITDPGSFAVINVLYGFEEQLTLVNAWDGQLVTRFGSVVFTRRGLQDLNTFEDLKGRSLMAVAPQAFGGWNVARREFKRAGLAPSEDLAELKFADGNQTTVVRAVLDGTVDAGVVRTGTLEWLERQGVIALDEFKILGMRSVPGFPFALSTELYPEWVFADPPNTATAFRHDVLTALAKIETTDRPAVAGDYFGWESATDYDSVVALLRELNAAPFQYLGKSSRVQFWQENRVTIGLSTAALVSLISLLLYALRQRSKYVRLYRERARKADSELHLYHSALDQHSIMSTTNADGVITDVNDRFLEVSGYSRKEIIGKTHDILHTDLVPAERYEDMQRTIQAGKIWSGELANRRKDGGIWWVQSTIVPRFGPAGDYAGCTSIRTDVTELKAAQAEMNLRHYLECTAGEVYKFLIDTHAITFSNSAAQRSLGLSEEELEGRTLFDFLSASDAAWLRDELAKLVGNRRATIEFERDRILPDGRKVATHFHIQYLHVTGIEPRFVATLTDISEETETRNLVVELSNTLDAVNDQIFMFWPDTKKFFYANRAAKLSLGLSDDELRNMTPSDLVGGLSPEECGTVLGPLIRGETRQQVFRRKVTTPNGEEKVMEYDIRLASPKGHKPRFIAILRDRTEHAQAEMELMQLRTSLDLMDDEFYMFWPESYAFTYMSKNALDRVGWGNEGWRGRHTFDYITKRQQAWLKEKCDELMTGDEKSMTYETIDRNGTPLEIYLRLIEPENEKPRFMSIYRDITEKKQAETAKSEFISTISHELRTPLTSIKGSLRLLKSGVIEATSDRHDQMIEIASMNADRLHDLINDILDWEKIEAGEMSYEFGDTDICAAIQESVELNNGYARQHDVYFKLTAPIEPVMCRADKGRLQQVFSNLMSNAAKFSDKGMPIDISVTVEGDEAVVAVRDYGAGIPETARPTIFNRFTQADSSTERHKGGTGLGLSISKAIVNTHDGSIGFEDAEGGGTRFYVRLPLLSTNQRSALDQSELHVADTRPKPNLGHRKPEGKAYFSQSSGLEQVGIVAGTQS
ncbi:MAG: PAS domain S-box protein [Paracoccaceae bacterium]|nr:PAS domain S-box protein [Paracoccaceae bacterium]MDP7184544.1 PAS domain S-box protein [Paracoccaceae bacterium]